ncbi:uroporphyrinogen-III C-methyltransferase [Jatrophihabitans sp. YIM 134969]
MTGLPLFVDLAGRRVLVVGAGPVGARRAHTLVEAGALVEVVAPEVHAVLPAAVVHHARTFVAPDLDDAWLVVAATDDPAVQERIAAACDDRRIFCVRADDATGGTARVAASVTRGEVTVAVSGGDDPRRAVTLLGAVTTAVDLGTLPTRPVRAARRGHVSLVGGGPGDPELITVRGRRLLAEADVVVTDRLAPTGLLEGLPPGVEIVDAGKSAHRHNLTQAEINALLVDRARAGQRVVRLKGGDPFLFGRGGEELIACTAAGVDVTVVPGVSSAFAGPAAAGIPVTHRGVATDVTIVSAHLDPGRPADAGLDWPALGTSGSTLVVLMGMDRLDLIAKELIRHGRSPRTPAAVVHRATLPGERVVRAELADLPAAVAAAGIGAPAIVVVGPVVDVVATAARQEEESS